MPAPSCRKASNCAEYKMSVRLIREKPSNPPAFIYNIKFALKDCEWHCSGRRKGGKNDMRFIHVVDYYFSAVLN